MEESLYETDRKSIGFKKKTYYFLYKILYLSHNLDLALFTYLALTYFFYFDAWMIILQNMIMLPQIVYNVRSGNRSVFEPSYVLGYLGSRILIPFY